MADKRPSDIHPETGMRLPPVDRDAMDPKFHEMFDKIAKLQGPGNVAGLRGPSGVNFHSPVLAEHTRNLNQYLRYGSGIDGATREIAILASARETNSAFEWTAHEPIALEEGVSPDVIDVIKYRKALDGLDPAVATVIQLGREVVSGKTVSAETYDAAHALFGDRKLVEVVTMIAHYAATAMVLKTFDNQMLPGRESLLPVD